MAERIKIGDMVEFIKGGIAHGMKGQVKKAYHDTPEVRVVLIPETHCVTWRTEDVKKI